MIICSGINKTLIITKKPTFMDEVCLEYSDGKTNEIRNNIPIKDLVFKESTYIKPNYEYWEEHIRFVGGWTLGITSTFMVVYGLVFKFKGFSWYDPLVVGSSSFAGANMALFIAYYVLHSAPRCFIKGKRLTISSKDFKYVLDDPRFDRDELINLI